MEDSTKGLWKEQINAEARESMRKELGNMQAKVDYLKNPRHVPPSSHGGAGTLIKGNKKEPKQFGAKPPPEPER